MVPLTPTLAAAVLCGLGGGAGLWMLATLLPPLGRARLMARVAPYLSDVSEGARDYLGRRSATALPVLGALLSPLLDGGRNALERLLGGGALIELRLRQAASPRSLSRFRSEQLLAGAGGAALGVLVALVAVGGGSSIPLSVLLPVVLALCGIVGRDALLRRAATARRRQILGELPTMLEFLTVSLSAGEGIFDALARVARIGHGAVAAELGIVVAEHRAGVPLPDALLALSRRLELAPVTRLVDQLIGAIERGAPLAEVLQAQAQDSRDRAKRDLLESAGQREIAMMVPLVFLILPVTVLFAIFPGITVLRMGF